MEDTLKFIEDQKIISVIRASDHEDAEAIAKAVLDGGINVIEFTPNIPHVNKLIENLASRKGIRIGLGSVTDGEQAHRAISSGAKFISCLYTDRNVLTVCINNEVPVIQGAQTVTEVMEAHQLGIDLIKIYPADLVGGPNYVQRLKRSFPYLKLVPSGGVNCENILDYIKAGAVACSVGKALCDRNAMRNHQWSLARITEMIF